MHPANPSKIPNRIRSNVMMIFICCVFAYWVLTVNRVKWPNYKSAERRFRLSPPICSLFRFIGVEIGLKAPLCQRHICHHVFIIEPAAKAEAPKAALRAAVLGSDTLQTLLFPHRADLLGLDQT